MPVQKAEALFDFHPTATVELELKKGDIVAVRRKSVGEGWWEGELNGKRGLFPSSFVKMLPMSASSSPRMDKFKATLSPGSSKTSLIETPLTPVNSKRTFLEKLMAPLTPVTDKKPFLETPLTPGISKKAFMETLLTPSIVTQDQVYDKEKSAELYVQGHSNISIAAGPKWDSFPPTLTVVIKNLHTQTRFSGVKHFTVFDVETKQLGVQVTRRYKSFLWFYDKLAELFPCLSLPPLPVKQLTGLEDHGIEARRRGLENFLNRIANHPVLGSTKLLRDFLTERDDKDWKIGRQMSNIKLPKSAKKLFNAPVYSTIKYPPFNVPINQLASIEKFSHFSRLMELNVQALHHSCQQLCKSSGDMMSSVSCLGRDINRMARGMQPIAKAQRRKLAAGSHPNVNVPNGQSPFHLSTLQRTPSFVEEVYSEGELDNSFEWNWRDDSKFNCMMKEFYDLAGGMNRLSNLQQTFCDSMERNVLDSLSDYSGIIHTLPILVHLHEDAMEVYDTSKEKDTRKEAEEVRQHCETLNNIILAEFDHFSNKMRDDFENIMLSILKEQAEFHRQLANEWNAMYQQYHTKRSSQRRQSTDRITSSGKSFSFEKSGSFSGSFPSSCASSHSMDKGDIDKDSTTPVQALPVVNSKGSSIIPTYINVERMPSKKRDSWEKINEDELKSPLDRSKSSVKSNPLNQVYDSSVQDSWEKVSESELKIPPLDMSAKASTKNHKVHGSTHQECEADIPENGTNAGSTELFESVIVHESEIIQESEVGPSINQDRNSEHGEVHSYANINFGQLTGSTVSKPALKPDPGSPKKPKKPMPIRRRNTSPEGEVITHQESPISSSLESSSSPNVRANIPLKPPPPVKVSKKNVSSLTSSSSGTHCVLSNRSEYQAEGGCQSESDRGQSSGGGGQSSSEENVKETVIQSIATSRHQSDERKPKSKTILNANTNKKQPILPPPSLNKHTPAKESKSHGHGGGNSTKFELSTRGTVSTVVIHSPTSSKLRLSEPATSAGHSKHLLVKSQSIPISQAASTSDTSHKNRDELMKKLSQRKQRIEQQLGINKSSSHRPNIANIAETPSERDSTISTSSSLSEVVVVYTTKRSDSSLGNSSANAAVQNNESEVCLRRNLDDDDLSGYGIIEDTDSGSYLI